MNRQIKLVKNHTNDKFEDELFLIQKENLKILSELKGDLSIKSAYLFSNLKSELISLSDKFFVQKFQSAS